MQRQSSAACDSAVPCATAATAAAAPRDWKSIVVNGKASPPPAPARKARAPVAVDTRPTSPLAGLDKAVRELSLLMRQASADQLKQQPAWSPPQNHRWRMSPTNQVRSPSMSSSSGSTASPGPASPQPAAVDSRKCGDKRDFFFRHLDYDTRSQLQIDDVAAFSVTEVEMAKKISNVILELVQASVPAGNNGKCPVTITDGTACVGGNVMSFCDYFLNVNAVENDATRFEMLQHNLTVLGKTNATCFHASYLDVMTQLDQLVVFLDPPWGGVDYKDHARVDLFLDNVPLYTICERLKTRAHWVVLKVPSNFNDDKFARHVTGDVSVREDFRKMHLVIVDNRHLHAK
ncbi:TPA: hypothetical protein N0F65_009833 [Lagenidium giganteum]|uniref:Trimethylguanosine synthase n=1 Tax=Lagenidium giganteum TaxID=4803 RepID=A0AAV2YTH2_9STRA|nr:TPA: hypothetical protein N0F65_009833 [Lagenidium giganteum]